jgi:lactoylglutathione lyase
MPLLFTYGMLQREEVQMATFGRLLEGQRDELVGFERGLLRVDDPTFVVKSGKADHAVVRFNGRYDSRVGGVVYEVTENELASADSYEPDPYVRVTVMLASGNGAWVYVDARNAPAVKEAGMKAVFKTAHGYQGDSMNLPVVNVDGAIPFYETVMGFNVVSRSDTPYKSAALGRDSIQIGLAENGGDSTQDGCAFEVDSVESAFAELRGNGLEKEISGFDTEQHGGVSWKVFYVVAPDGLCYWLGERQAG